MLLVIIRGEILMFPLKNTYLKKYKKMFKCITTSLKNKKSY